MVLMQGPAGPSGEKGDAGRKGPPGVPVRSLFDIAMSGVHTPSASVVIEICEYCVNFLL